MDNLKVKAAVMLAGWIGCVFAGVAIVQLIAHYFGSELVMNLLVGSLILWLIYGVYQLILMKLQWEAKVDELNHKR